MSACLGALPNQEHVHSASGLTEYVIYRVCVPISPRVFDTVSRNALEEPSAPCGRGVLMASTTARPGTLYLEWTGTISGRLYKGMAVQFEKAKKSVRRVLLQISSCGGDREEMERTIRLLRHIKETHALETIVDRGDICGSACVAVFLQGRRRRGALTSSLLFHEAWYWADRYSTDVRWTAR
jgi:hypothetical protein